ncbi:MAG: 7-carboxy-7-deazaguanine synthase QueE [Romboutsia timonensis]
MIPVAEIFGPTIQGEGPHVGIKTLFVRVAGCDFKCAWCDSKFAWGIDTDTKRYQPEELSDLLIKKCKETNTSNVILTGGNPCLYDFSKVVEKLHNHNITVDVETQGSKLPEWLHNIDLLVISPKAPSSGQKDVYKNVNEFIRMAGIVDDKIAIKIPVFNEEDFQFAEKYYTMVEYYRNHGVKIDLYLSVGNNDVHEDGDISGRILKDYKFLIERVANSDMKRVFVLPQVHTLVWGNKQGV